MANFNWFSRSFNKSSDADKSETPKSPAPSAHQSEQPPADEPKTPAMSSEDYLAWAKAAYQNIQKQQASETADPPAETSADSVDFATDTPTPPVDGEGPPATLVSETTIAEPATAASPEIEAGASPATASPETTDEVVETKPIPEVEETAVTPAATEPKTTTSAAVETSEVIPVEAPATPEPSVAGPAWMQSATERQARLERLQETAIAEPEPEPEPTVTATTEPEQLLPDINFDEAFLWSAEVLAGQGRQAADISIEEITWLNKLRQGLDKTRRGLVNQLKAIVGQGPLNEDAVFEIEALLLQADVGVEATDTIIESLQARLREEALPPEQAIAYLKQLLRDMLDAPLGDSHNLEFVPDKGTFNIWLMTGVNGAGKTTTIGKLAHIAKKSGYNCLIGAADTFRAAAVEQVKAWGARSDVDVIANPGKNTDPAAVVFDAIAAAQSRQCELLLVDTAGRLQNKKNLMEELSKIRRIIDKKAPEAQIESLLVLDATLGQNGLQQAKVFAEAANLSGVVLTKLDGTARGGVALAVVQQLGLPIRFIGAGEGIEDLRPFSSYEFVEALLSG
ncbi:MAG: signal recognition particle-docking protein FtsY [Leptolyngbyaceae cyanobacterium]